MPERELIDPLPMTNKHYALIEQIKSQGIKYRGNASPLTKMCGNLHGLITPLRRQFY